MKFKLTCKKGIDHTLKMMNNGNICGIYCWVHEPKECPKSDKKLEFNGDCIDLEDSSIGWDGDY